MVRMRVRLKLIIPTAFRLHPNLAQFQVIMRLFEQVRFRPLNTITGALRGRVGKKGF